MGNPENIPTHFGIKEMLDLKMLWFDLDGTLVFAPPLRLHMEFIWRYLGLMSRHTHPIKSLAILSDVKKALLSGDTQVLGKSIKEKKSTNTERAIQSFSKGLGIDLKAGEILYRQILVDIFSDLAPLFRPMATALRVINGLYQENWPMLLATNPVWPLAVTEFRLNKAMIDIKAFRKVTHGDNMHCTKGSLQYYTDLLKDSGQSAQEILHIGNDIKKDLPAISQGVKVFILTDKHTKARHVRAWHQLNKEERSRCAMGTWDHLESMFIALSNERPSTQVVFDSSQRSPCQPPTPS